VSRCVVVYCIATYCNTLQHTATHYNTLRQSSTHSSRIFIAGHHSRCVAVCCRVLWVLQNVAGCWQSVVGCCTFFFVFSVERVQHKVSLQLCCRVGRCVTVCCGAMQGVAGCCRVLQGVAGCCRVLSRLNDARHRSSFVAVCCGLFRDTICP